MTSPTSTTDLPLRCRCGSLRGTALAVSGRNGNHVVCYCDDCQAYVRHLGTPGILDRHGGTDIYQTTPSQLRIDAGADAIRLLRLTPTGLMRWYAGCCRTPIANSLASPRVPFVGIVTTVLDPGALGRSLDDVLGAVIARVQARDAIGGAPAGSHPRMPAWYFVRSTRLLLGAWLRGKHRPSPFFDPATGEPVASAEVLTTEARTALRP